MNRLIAAMMPWLMLRSLRQGLAGVWGVAAPLPTGGAVLIANHHGWWDGYLLWFLSRRWGRRLAILIDERTLERFPFFRRLGGIAPREARRAARRVGAGDWLVVFPEGEITPKGALGAFAPGAQAISRWARAPIVPIGIRVVMRARQRPEAYLRVGATMAAGASTAAQSAEVEALLALLDADLAAATDAEAPLPGYESWLTGAPSTNERAERMRGWWSR
jgi:1-acyl-sn-glycerol-3-phosphate acyltransferase